MQAANNLQKALKGSKPAFGAWQMLPGANHAKLIARCGFDWILVDTEHGNIDGTVIDSLTKDPFCLLQGFGSRSGNETTIAH